MMMMMMMMIGKTNSGTGVSVSQFLNVGGGVALWCGQLLLSSQVASQNTDNDDDLSSSLSVF